MRVYVINTVYLVFYNSGRVEDVLIWCFCFFVSLSRPDYLWAFSHTKKTIPENDCFILYPFCFIFVVFLATAECDFTEKEAVWTGFFVRVNLKRKRKKAILFNFLCCRKKKGLSRCGRVEPWFFYGEALPGLCISVGFFLFLVWFRCF